MTTVSGAMSVIDGHTMNALVSSLTRRNVFPLKCSSKRVVLFRVD